MPRTKLVDDPWMPRMNQLLAEGWIFYSWVRYAPTVLLGYSTVFLSGSPVVRRKANKATHVHIRQQSETDANVWDGTINMAASALNPWVAGAAMPPDDADWAVGPTAHYLDDQPDHSAQTVNPLVWDELATVQSTPVVTLTKQYGNCSDPDTCLAAIRDLFTSITYPA